MHLGRHLTHILALSAGSMGPANKRTTPTATACRPGLNQEIMPLGTQDGALQCLEIPGGARAGAGVVVASCAPTAASNARLWRNIILLGNCTCLDVVEPKAGAEVVAKVCRRRRLWRLQDAQLRYARSNLCLDYTAALATPGARVVVNTCDARSAQQQFTIGPGASSLLPPPSTSGTPTPTQLPSSSGTSATPTTSAQPSGLTSPSSTSTAPTPSVPAAPAGYSLVWHDDFSAGTLNTSNWNFVVNCDNANHELECYTNSTGNVDVANGLLHISVIKEAYQGKNYTSGRINTYGKFDFTYGYIEANIQLPCGGGLWPAFWLMPSDSAYGPWPQSGELDIMEFLGKSPDVITATAHYGFDGATGNQARLSQGTFCDGFHRFGLQWSAQQINWTLDGAVYANLTNTQGDWAPAPKWPFDERFYVILNVAMGGDWPGPPDPNVLGGTMLVDYVRVYQAS